jgi:hypothetical protein
MYWVCMSSTYLTYCSYRRCDRDWLPPTWAYTVLASSPTGISKATGFPCLPSLIHILALSVPRLACVQTGVHRRQPSSSTRCSALVLSTNTHTGEDEEGVREKEDSLFYSTHSQHHNTHTHTAHRQKSAIHPSIHSLYGHPHRVPWSQSLHCTPPLPHETCFLTPHSALSAPSSALLAPVHHDNNRRRLFTHRGNPLAMHRSGTLPQHSSLGRS